MGAVLANRKLLQFLCLLDVFAVLCAVIVPSDKNVLGRLPPLIKALPGLINDSVNFLMFQ